MWLPPLDETVTERGVARRGDPRQWLAAGEIDRPFEMRRDPLVFDASSSAGNMVIHGGPRVGKSLRCRHSSSPAAGLRSYEVAPIAWTTAVGSCRRPQDLARHGSVASALERTHPPHLRRARATAVIVPAAAGVL